MLNATIAQRELRRKKATKEKTKQKNLVKMLKNVTSEQETDKNL